MRFFASRGLHQSLLSRTQWEMGFYDTDILSGVEGVYSDQTMQMVRRCDHHRIHIFVVQYAPVIAVSDEPPDGSRAFRKCSRWKN